MPTPATRLRTAWSRLSTLPGGRRVFDALLRWMVPYSGSIRPHVLQLEPGTALVSIRDQRRLRNHLRSVHAVALANLAELSSGLAMTLALPPDVRGIPVRIEIDYLKKARGTITGRGTAAPPDQVTNDTEAEATAELSDAEGDVVATATVTWKLSPRDDR